MEHLDITLDFETCSLAANAAVLQLGAVAWNRRTEDNPFILTDKDDNPIGNDSAWGSLPTGEGGGRGCESFNQSFDLRDQIFAGRDFDKSTIQWWAGNNDAVKQGILAMEPQATKDVLANFVEWVKELLSMTGAKSVCLWSQGTDFDIAILRSLTTQFNIELPRNLYKNFRDCRTYIMEIGAEQWLDNKLEAYTNPRAVYQAIEKECGKCPLLSSLSTGEGGGRGPHDALYDAIQSSWNTYQCYKVL